MSFATIAFFSPHTMLWFDKPWIFWSLAASMLGMGLTLSVDDLRRIARILGSVVLDFAAGYAEAKMFRYPESITRTVSIDGGMAASLAREHLPLLPLAAAVPMFGGVMQNTVGVDGACWRRRTPDVWR